MCIAIEAQGSELRCCLIYRTEYGSQHCKRLMLSYQIPSVVFWKGHAQLWECSAVSTSVTLLGREASGQSPTPGCSLGHAEARLKHQPRVEVRLCTDRAGDASEIVTGTMGEPPFKHNSQRREGSRFLRPQVSPGLPALLFPSQPWAATLPGGGRMRAGRLQYWPATTEVGIVYLSIKTWNEIT